MWWYDWSIFHWGGGGQTTASAVPEIDASSGALALAVIAAAMLLAWEVRRRKGA